jgi:hypothetical protein
LIIIFNFHGAVEELLGTDKEEILVEIERELRVAASMTWVLLPG